MAEGASDVIEKTGADKYQLIERDYDGDIATQLLFGYDKGASYVVLGGKDASAFGKVKKAFQKSDIKGKGIYAFFNFGFLKNIVGNMNGEDEVFVNYLISLFDYVEFYNEEGDGGKLLLRLVVKDKNKTPIEVMFENCYKFLSDLMDASRIEYRDYDDLEVVEAEPVYEADSVAYDPAA
jgi:hypothetical protein